MTSIVLYSKDQPNPGLIIQVVSYSENPMEEISQKLTAAGTPHILYNGDVRIASDYVDIDLEIVKPRPENVISGIPDKPLKADGVDKITLHPSAPNTHVQVYMAGTLIAEEDVGSDGLELSTQTEGTYVCIFNAPFPYQQAVVQIEASNEA